MAKKASNAWYQPLQAYYSRVENAMPIKRFAEIEAVLHLLISHAKDPEPEKAYLLFSQYQLIGMTDGTTSDHQLQAARYTLGCFRSRKYWQDNLAMYRLPIYDGLRAFVFEVEDDKTVLKTNCNRLTYSYDSRLAEWKRLWSNTIPRREAYPMADEGSYFYYINSNNYDDRSEKIKVSFSKSSLNLSEGNFVLENRPREPITVKISDLLQCAKEMQKIVPSDYCYEILKSNAIKAVENGKVTLSDHLTIEKTINIIGMVGSGKSTLIKIISYWAQKNDKKIVIVLDTVAEVFNLWQYFYQMNVNCSPLIGRNERLKYINQIIDPNKTCLSRELSKYLTNACLVDGMNESESLTYGKEPCFSLKHTNKGSFHLCPHFDHCPGTKMLRECYTSSVVLTTVAGLAVARVGKNREPFLDVAMRNFDIVIFDESDRVQKTLDQLFMPETSFDHFIKECADDCSHYMKLSVIEREKDRASQYYSELQLQSTGVMSCLTKALNWDLGKWNRLSAGEPFSALTLLDDLRNDEKYQIPDKIYNDIYSLIDIERNRYNLSSALNDMLNAACDDTDFSRFNDLYDRWLEEENTSFKRTEQNHQTDIQDARIKLVICLIYFDHFIRKLSDAYTACHETSLKTGGQNELFGFLQTRFSNQQKVLPSALCGNLFGMKKNDQGDIVLFRQFAFGRSLMKDLPYLLLDPNGNAAGPHVIMLSGSSWAEGSYEYHVNRPVNYILEPEPSKKDFLKGTRFFESGFDERVSGSGEMRIEMLKKVTQKSADYIIGEYDRKDGKILIIVNSYEQAGIVRETLQNALQKKQCSAGICRMVSDANNHENSAGIVRRGEVSRFAAMPEDILIAPAMAIERGHNIVDETGHSALSAVFFMVRPMSVPDDVQEKGSKLNGYMEAHCKRNINESIWEYNTRMRYEATKRWAIVTRSGHYGLDNLTADDQKDVVATLFILILQIFGRLARVTDTNRAAPHIYFMDGAFRKREDASDGFDCLNSLGMYLDDLMQDKDNSEIAKTLYLPFYEAYKKGIEYGR